MTFPDADATKTSSGSSPQAPTTSRAVATVAIVLSFFVMSSGVTLNYVLIDHLSQVSAAPRTEPSRPRLGLILTA